MIQRALRFTAIASIAAAATVGFGQYFEDFDSYASGSQIVGQGGWEAWRNLPNTGALLSNTYSSTGPNSLAAAQNTDVLHRHFGYTSGKWTYKTEVYVPSQG